MHRIDDMSIKQCSIREVQHTEAKPGGGTAAQPAAAASRWKDSSIREVQHTEAKPGGGTAAQPAAAASRWKHSSPMDVARACHRKLAAVPAAGPLIFLFVICLAVAYGRRGKAKNKTKKSMQERAFSMMQRSVSMAALCGGQTVMERLMDSQVMQANQETLDEITADMQQLLDQHPIDFVNLSKTARKLEMSGNEDVAIEMLQMAIKNAEKSKKSHEAYELQMLAVEMLIYKGEYQNALSLGCLQDEHLSDARIPLYKAIIYIITGNNDEAKECYEEFQNVRSFLHSPETQNKDTKLFHAMHEYEEFVNLVENLRREIERTHKSRS